MKFTYFPADEEISFEIDSLHFINGTNGHTDSRQNGHILVVVSKSEDVNTIACTIITSILSKWTNFENEESKNSFVTKKIAYEFIDGKIKDRKIYLQIEVGDKGWKSPGTFKIG